MTFLRSLVGLLDLLREHLMWRDDWDRTWSPVSYWLGVVTFLILVVSIVLHGGGVMRVIADVFSTSP